MLRFLSTVLLLAVALCASAQQPRGFTAKDLVMLDRVGDPQLSPDGKTVAFTVRSTDFEANKGITGLWTVPLSGGEPKRISAEGTSIGSPRWAPDGSALYVLSSASGSSQVWRVPATGGAARQVTDLPLDVGSFAVGPAGKRLALSLDVFTDCEDLACTRQRLDAKQASKRTGVLYDQLFVRHWDTWADGRRNQLFVLALGEDGSASGEPVRVSRGVEGDVPSKPFGDAGEYAWAPDGSALVFAAREGGSAEAWSTDFDLYRAPADGSAPPANLTADNAAWDTAPVFSKDGGTLYYLAMQRPGFEADRFRIMALDLDSGALRELAPDWDRSAGSLALGPDGTLYATADDIGQHPLFAIDARRGTVQRLPLDGWVTGYDVGARGIVIARDALDAPTDLYVARNLRGEPQRLTHFNRERLAGVRFGTAEQFSFQGAAGGVVHGYLVRPWNFEEGRKYPVAFIIHGGPQGSMANHFHYRWNPQTYAGQGYAVVMVDFHGSTGYGQAFTDAISQDWGGKPLEDLKEGYAHALQAWPFLDAERACALGASYGGYMVNWIAGNWQQPWKCLVNHDGVFDNRMMYYATEELWFVEWEHGGPQYAVPQNYERFNPVNHVEDWSVPMLVVQGELDYRIPVTQGLATFTALQRRNIPSQFLYFPDENHWVLKPHNSLQWHETVEAWLARWTPAN